MIVETISAGSKGKLAQTSTCVLPELNEALNKPPSRRFLRHAGFIPLANSQPCSRLPRVNFRSANSTPEEQSQTAAGIQMLKGVVVGILRDLPHEEHRAPLHLFSAMRERVECGQRQRLAGLDAKEHERLLEALLVQKLREAPSAGGDEFSQATEG